METPSRQVHRRPIDDGSQLTLSQVILLAELKLFQQRRRSPPHGRVGVVVRCAPVDVDIDRNCATKEKVGDIMGYEVFEHNGFYFHEDNGDFITYSWIGRDDRYEAVIIGHSEAEARQCLDDHPNGELGSGLSACDDREIVEGHAEYYYKRKFE
jgi:hypothetical protein